MRLFLTDHAKERMAERQVSLPQVIAALRGGQVVKKGHPRPLSVTPRRVTEADLATTKLVVELEVGEGRLCVVTAPGADNESVQAVTTYWSDRPEPPAPAEPARSMAFRRLPEPSLTAA